MTIRDFADLVKDRIKEYLPYRYIDAEMEVKEVTKNNGIMLVGLCVKRKGVNLCPTIYLEGYYQYFSDCMDIEDILSSIAQAVERHEGGLNFDVNRISSFDSCRRMIYPKLVNSDMNREILRERPHREIVDLSVMYQITLKDNGLGGIGNIAISNDIMDKWGISEKELYDTAIDNLERNEEFTLESIGSVLSNFMGDNDDMDSDLCDEDFSEGIGIYVLTNKEKCNGANSLLNFKVMNEISGRFGNDYYILPSSIHEVLIVPKRSELNADMLRDLVRSVNAQVVEREIQLSDNVYEYTEKGLQIAV